MTDLAALLEQTAGKGINVYTHGEMLPAHGYPKLKAHGHLKGNYGGAWQLQKFEYGAFPGPIVQVSRIGLGGRMRCSAWSCDRRYPAVGA